MERSSELARGDNGGVSPHAESTTIFGDAERGNAEFSEPRPIARPFEVRDSNAVVFGRAENATKRVAQPPQIVIDVGVQGDLFCWTAASSDNSELRRGATSRTLLISESISIMVLWWPFPKRIRPLDPSIHRPVMHESVLALEREF